MLVGCYAGGSNPVGLEGRVEGVGVGCATDPMSWNRLNAGTNGLYTPPVFTAILKTQETRERRRYSRELAQWVGSGNLDCFSESELNI